MAFRTDIPNHIIRIQQQYNCENPEGLKKNFNAKRQLQYFLDHCQTLSDLVAKLEKAVLAYAHKNFNQVGTGDSFVKEEVNIGTTTSVARAKKFTNSDRVIAVNLLLEIIKTSSADDIYQYVTTPEFKKISGNTTKVKLTFLREHLDTVIQPFVDKYDEIKNECTPALLATVLLDDEVRANVSYGNLAKLFWFYHPILVADIIVNIYPVSNFPYPISSSNSDQPSYDFALMMKFLDADVEAVNSVNLERCRFKLSQILPPNSCTPGVDRLADESLSIYELFQYDESTIFGVEEYLRRNFQHLFFNQVTYPDQVNLRDASAAPYYFYFLSAASYMLLEPTEIKNTNYFRYTEFKKNLQDLLVSYTQNKMYLDKPIIFCGIINIDGVHYIPWFVHKNHNTNQVQVITVDPSPTVYPHNFYESDQPKDSKLKTRQKLQRIFQDIFPGCHYFDPDVTQMLRQRDCGPNSATTLSDAFTTCTSMTPLLRITWDQGLQINPEALSMAGAAPIGINQYTNKYVYPIQLQVMSKENRVMWMQRLVQLKEVVPITLRKQNSPHDHAQAMSIYDQYDYSDQFVDKEYNYITKVETQGRQDAKETNISAVQSLLQSYPEGWAIIRHLIDQYQQTLVLPNSRELVDYIQLKVGSKEELNALIAAHDNNITLLAKDVISLILFYEIPTALKTVFKQKILQQLPVSTDLKVDIVVDDFLRQNIEIVNRLTIHQQKAIRNELIEMAMVPVKKCLLEAHRLFAENLISQHCRAYLNQLPMILPSIANVQLRLIKDIALKTSQNDPSLSEKIQASFTYLEINDSKFLSSIFWKEVEKISQPIVTHTVESLIARLATTSVDIETMLKLCNPQGEFIPWDSHRLQAELILLIGNTIRLQASEVNSYLGTLVLAQFNGTIAIKIKRLIEEAVSEKIQTTFMSEKFISNMLAKKKPNELLTKLGFYSSQSDIFSSEYLDVLFKEYCPSEVLKQIQYLHVYIKTMVIAKLRERVYDIFYEALKRNYYSFAINIINANQSFLIFQNALATFPGLDSNEILLNKISLILYNKYKTSSYESNIIFLTSFLDSDQQSFNPFGVDFDLWFKDDLIANNLIAHCQIALGLLNNLRLSCEVIKNIKNNLPANTSINCDNRLSNLYNLQMQIQQLSLVNLTLSNDQAQPVIDHFEEQFKLIYYGFIKEIHVLCYDLYNQYYKRGELTPESITSKLRPDFCRLLNIEVPPILKPMEAVRVDDEIKDSIYDLTYRSNHLLNPNIALLSLPKLKDLPDTYGQPLTLNLLIQCVAYWFEKNSVFYNISHPSLWMADENMPNFMHIIIKSINKLSLTNIDPNQELLDIDISHLKRYLISGANLQIYGSDDLQMKIRAALLRTSTLHNSKETSLSFAEITQFIALNEAKNKAKQKPKSETVQTQTQTFIPLLNESELNQRALHTYRDLHNQGIKTTFAKVKNQIQAEYNSGINTSSILLTTAAPITTTTTTTSSFTTRVSTQRVDTEVVSVQKAQLQRGRFESMALFGGALTPIEKLLLQIQNKHNKQEDFKLDEDDIEILNRALKMHWRQMVEQKGRSAAADLYCERPHRKDRIYIAMAEILAIHYRSLGQVILSHELLMPNSGRFLYANELKHKYFPQSICKEIGLNQEELPVYGIPLANLMTTRSGYAFNIDWILRAYEKKRELNNPYTDKKLTREELKDICSYPKAQALINMVKANHCSFITPRVIQLLKEYLNTAIFTKGFTAMYNIIENKIANDAFVKLQKELSKLPKEESEAFYKETIPGDSSMTIAEVFADSEMREDSAESCLTSQGVFLAKVVIAYEGESHHGLTNSKLVNQAGSVSRRHYMNAKDTAKSFEEQIIMQSEEERAYAAVKYKRN